MGELSFGCGLLNRGAEGATQCAGDCDAVDDYANYFYSTEGGFHNNSTRVGHRPPQQPPNGPGRSITRRPARSRALSSPNGSEFFGPPGAGASSAGGGQYGNNGGFHTPEKRFVPPRNLPTTNGPDGRPRLKRISPKKQQQYLAEEAG